jgi:hypothetical protein
VVTAYSTGTVMEGRVDILSDGLAMQYSSGVAFSAIYVCLIEGSIDASNKSLYAVALATNTASILEFPVDKKECN